MAEITFRQLSERTETFVQRMLEPLEHYSLEDRKISAEANVDLRGVYARAFVELMRKRYDIVPGEAGE